MDLAKAPVRVYERAMREVSPGRDELIVIAANEVGPREIAVLRLGTGQHQVEAQRVGVIARQKVVDIDDHPTAGRKSAALHRQELARDDVVRELQRLAPAACDPSAVAVAEQDRGPDRRVEDDVVLPHEIEMARLWILPPVAPCIGPSDHSGPLDRGGEVADDRVEPYVHPFVRAVFPTWQ